MLTLENLWTSLTDYFKTQLNPVSYETWISSAEPKQFINNDLIIELPSQLHKTYWIQHLAPKVVAFLYETTGEEINPVLQIKGEITASAQTKMSLANTAQSNNDNVPTFMRDAKLNDRYTFSTFVTGKGNQMAHAAALVVSEEPGRLYNPLFFYGGVGLGKTHLMHAIGHQMLLNNPDAKVKYVTSEAFTNGFINSLRNNTPEDFRKEYRSVDLLLVDDIQFFADKESTQEEFFHTFNSLYDDKKQIVLSSDRLPNEIPKLQKRLISRFKWGLSVDITPPDLETRIAILRNKSDAENLEIPDDTLSYIAGQIDSNIRELEGALVRVQAYATLSNSEITTSLAADALKNLSLKDKSNEVSIAIVQDRVAKYFHVTVSDLKGKKRVKAIVMPRQIAMYLSRELTENSLPKIGSEFGGKDHTTVIHAHEKIAVMLETDDKLQRQISDLKSELN
ncbi:chromosomal replication initiator protein DnaA [Dellaglioa algida]|uniref:Chromosomal replication initiator protein DnaA n=1 Tax=Dellaglioa carnosa TaxID=2995136 RepID=A0ABT4JMY6_9LACO|nr:chromosomal replication initiator protein DnaA [Dellaglioa carnosa]TWW12771.1 chromosomal replication initiator protein DnaA [Dellaglioa algida]MCZ2491197.1 chromosomal replication initiator protein DnaA [Dellaglioa carnosa]MCZ2493565.1 chromosomal replication initiator protein DnaA [Dellaglioa carnosa]MCZ2494275.1 chromosomal replication initiator protein DnaA [Dellaglioa carnosa]MDK1731309.1 chromosomal replication initiator protein DnaA [Dellaglioa carnosa]